MAEQRPYRAPGGAASRLLQVKKYAAATVGLSFIIVNWMTTQHAALLMGDSPRLGRALFALPWLGPIYAPWKWMVWAWSWYAIERMQPLWIISSREVLLPDGTAYRACSRSDCVDPARMVSDHGGPPWFGPVGDQPGRQESRVFRDPDVDLAAFAAPGDGAPFDRPTTHQGGDLLGLVAAFGPQLVSVRRRTIARAGIRTHPQRQGRRHGHSNSAHVAPLGDRS